MAKTVADSLIDLIGTHYQQDVDLDKFIHGYGGVALARRTVAHITVPKDIQERTSSKEVRRIQSRRST